MKKKKGRLVFMIISMLLFVGLIGVIISMRNIDKQTEDITTSYTATVRDINIIDTGKKIFVEIHTKEYNTSLQISTNISKNIKMDDVRDLKNGQTIFFRIENIKMKQMNKVDFIDIVSLRTEAKDIFTLEDYNTYIHNSAYPARIAGSVMAFIFLGIVFFCALRNKKSRTI